MRRRLRTYTAYSIGCFLVWGIVLAVSAIVGGTDRLHTILLIFAGWVICWISATIARYVYPPPNKWRRPNSSA
jgi:hypothetical protein